MKTFLESTETQGEQGRWKSYWPCLLLAALAALFFGDLLFSGKTFVMRDTFCNFYPWRVYARQSLAAGEIPWWNPYSGYGKPFVADPQMAFFYPLHILFYLLPVALAFKVCWLLHFWIAGASTFALCRYWRLGVTASLVAAVAFMFNTLLVAYMEYLSSFATLVWTPLVLLLLNLVIDVWAEPSRDPSFAQRIRNSTRPAALLALVLAVQFLAGQAEFYLFSCIFCGIFLLARCVHQVRGWRIAGFLLVTCSAGALALGLVLPQLVFTLEFLPYTERAMFNDPQLWFDSVSLRHLLTLIFPFLFGKPGYPDKFWAESIFEFWAGTCHFGIIPLLLLPWAAICFFKKDALEKRQRYVVWTLFLLGLGGLVIAMGKYTPAATVIYQLPVFNHLRWPSKFLEWVWIAGALLSGFGYQVFCDFAVSAQRRRWLRLFCVTILISFVILALGYAWIREVPNAVAQLTGCSELGIEQVTTLTNDYLLGLLFFGGGAGLLWLRFVRGKNKHLIEALIIAFIFVNLYIIGRQIHPVLPDYVYTSPPPASLLAQLESDEWHVHPENADVGQNLYGERREAVYEWAKTIGVEDCWLPWGVYSTYAGGFMLVRNFLLCQSLNDWPLETQLQVSRLANIRYLMRGMSNEAGGLSIPSVHLVLVTNCLPRVFLVNRWQTVGDSSDIPEDLISSNTPEKLALVEFKPGKNPRLSPPPYFDANAPEFPLANAVRVFQPKRNRVHVEVNANGRSLLVLNDTWYPGWKAFVDGKERPIYRANLWFRGVFLEAGEHNVDFVYRPSHLGPTLGVALFSGSLLCLLLIWPPRNAGAVSECKEAIRLKPDYPAAKEQLRVLDVNPP